MVLARPRVGREKHRAVLAGVVRVARAAEGPGAESLADQAARGGGLGVGALGLHRNVALGEHRGDVLGTHFVPAAELHVPHSERALLGDGRVKKRRRRVCDAREGVGRDAVIADVEEPDALEERLADDGDARLVRRSQVHHGDGRAVAVGRRRDGRGVVAGGRGRGTDDGVADATVRNLRGFRRGRGRRADHHGARGHAPREGMEGTIAGEARRELGRARGRHRVGA